MQSTATIPTPNFNLQGTANILLLYWRNLVTDLC